jgi:hypothetical protein
MADKVTMVGLEERLAGDKDKVELNKLIAELDGYLAVAKKALDAGLKPEEFRNMSKYRDALQQARDVAPLVWASSVNM